MNAIINVTTAIANWFWGWPILIIMIGGGLYLTFRCGFVQIRRFGYICSQTFGKMFQKAEKGKISSFGAACAALDHRVLQHSRSACGHRPRRTGSRILDVAHSHRGLLHQILRDRPGGQV